MVKNMNDINKLINVLDKIQTSSTLTEVAKKLYFSQPYVSKLISEMEKQYGVQLVNRKDSPISLTNAGEVIVQNLKVIQDAQEKLNINLINLKRTEQGTILIATCSLVDGLSIDYMAQELYKKYPKLKFNFVNLTGDLTDHDLTSGKIDIAVGRKWNNQGLHIIPLPIKKLGLLIPETSVLFDNSLQCIKFSQDNLSTLNGCNYIGVNDSSFLQHKVNILLNENGIHVNKIMELPDSRQAARVALNLHATTITTEKIAKDALSSSQKYNLMMIPENDVSLNMAISYRKQSSDDIKSVAKSIDELICS
jgi:DNA-binding transcriptional LysR family regulator